MKTNYSPVCFLEKQYEVQVISNVKVTSPAWLVGFALDLTPLWEYLAVTEKKGEKKREKGGEKPIELQAQPAFALPFSHPVVPVLP